MKPKVKCFLVLLPVCLGLFFGLFFGLNYPEIVRNGFPRTKCTVRASQVTTRYCCERTCGRGCSSAPIGSPLCGPYISELNTLDPGTCATNSTSCAPTSSVCNGGYRCCATCCDTCQSCTNSCSKDGSCTTSCSSYSCNCRCCDSTPAQYCQVSCPTCYRVELRVDYKTWSGDQITDVPVVQDFGKDNNRASSFNAEHYTNSTASCYYNPKNNREVLLNVNFTGWKWAISAIFGMVPLLVLFLFFATTLFILPMWKLVGEGYRDALTPVTTFPSRAKQWVVGNWKKEPPRNEKEVDEPPPAYEAPATSSSRSSGTGGVEEVSRDSHPELDSVSEIKK